MNYTLLNLFVLFLWTRMQNFFNNIKNNNNNNICCSCKQHEHFSYKSLDFYLQWWNNSGGALHVESFRCYVLLSIFIPSLVVNRLCSFFVDYPVAYSLANHFNKSFCEIFLFKTPSWIFFCNSIFELLNCLCIHDPLFS